VRLFGQARWDIFDLRRRLGIVSGELQHRFVNGNHAGSICSEDAVLSGCFATHGVLRGLPVTAEMRARALEALTRVDAAHLAARPLDELSTGEVRRVMLARALVASPEALILDEPTTGLDLVTRARFLDVVDRIAEQGTTVVMITHYIEEIIPAIGRVVLIKHGRIVDAGPKASILTSRALTALYDAPVHVESENGHYRVRLT
jgi:iron complex transport system ATP-binding protein